MLHFPVLLEESIDLLIHDKNGLYIDGTFGRGCHSDLILDKISTKGFLSAFDKDPDAVRFASKYKQPNFKIYHDSFKNFNKYFKTESIDGILYDLGTCSTHFDNSERGFSFNKDGPLDMRFDNTKGNSLSDWLNNAPLEEIISVLYKYGDEKHAKLIANTIEDERKKKPILRTCQLAEIISQKYPEKKKKIHPATKSFQAFRIFINDELEEFKLSLNAAKNILKKDGMIVTIAFHSLEDNIIKNFFKPFFKSFPKDIPLNNIEEKNFLRVKTSGKINFQKQIYLYNLNESGKPGFEVINPILINNKNYLINRGWIPFDKKDKPEINLVNQTNIVGTLKTQSKANSFKPKNDIKKNYWFTLDRDDIFKYTGKKFSKYIIYLNGDYSLPKPKVVTAKISNNHKKYAITWFSMAISILLIYLYFRKKNY